MLIRWVQISLPKPSCTVGESCKYRLMFTTCPGSTSEGSSIWAAGGCQSCGGRGRLFQADEHIVDWPVSFFFFKKKYPYPLNNSVIEKETPHWCGLGSIFRYILIVVALWLSLQTIIHSHSFICCTGWTTDLCWILFLQPFCLEIHHIKSPILWQRLCQAHELLTAHL